MVGTTVGKSILVATSITTSTTVSVIPTDTKRSPDPYWGEVTFLVYPSGESGNYNGNSYIYRSYGHLFDRLFQISHK